MAADPLSTILGAVTSGINLVGTIIKTSAQKLRDVQTPGAKLQDYNAAVQTNSQAILQAAIKEKQSQNEADSSLNVALVIGGVLVVLFFMYLLFKKK